MALPSYEGADRAMMPSTTKATPQRKLSESAAALVAVISYSPACSADLEIELFLPHPDRTSDERAPVLPAPDAE